jgi:hypothetical protein
MVFKPLDQKVLPTNIASTFISYNYIFDNPDLLIYMYFVNSLKSGNMLKDELCVYKSKIKIWMFDQFNEESDYLSTLDPTETEISKGKHQLNLKKLLTIITKNKFENILEQRV